MKKYEAHSEACTLMYFSAFIVERCDIPIVGRRREWKIPLGPNFPFPFKACSRNDNLKGLFVLKLKFQYLQTEYLRQKMHNFLYWEQSWSN